jgi:predicted dehydrogenase
MTARTLRIGLMSFAHVHAERYAAILRDGEDVELLAADPDGTGDDRGAALAERLGVRYVADYDELLAWQPHGVLVCAESARHRPVVEKAASAGAHVLCEKPLATTTGDARAMVAACAAAGVNLMTAYPVRFHPSFRVMARQVRAGRLGLLRTAVGINNGRAPFDERRWFGESVLAGGGAVMDHTVHLADLVGELVDAAPVDVYAQANRILHGGSGDVETGGLVFVTYDDGFVATIDCSWSEPAGSPTWGGLSLSVLGTDGSVSFDAFNEQVTVYDDRAGRMRWADCGTDLDALMLDEFLAAIRAGRPAQPDGAVGLRTLALVEAAYASIASGLPVSVSGGF